MEQQQQLETPSVSALKKWQALERSKGATEAKTYDYEASAEA